MFVQKNIREPKFLLMYSPQRFDRRFGAVKPEGSLGIAYLAGALRNNNFDVTILDCCVGNDDYNLDETFNREIILPNGMIRIGLSDEEIVREVRDYNVIGISSIFTAQTSMVEATVKAISLAYPLKIIILGGVNARSQTERFFRAGADVICLSESERTIVRIGEALRAGKDFSGIDGIAWKANGEIHSTPAIYVEQHLDNLPVPAWDMLPLQKYWAIARPHGGGFSPDKPVKYASAMTSRGCPYKCEYCHVGNELEGSISGNIRKWRQKSLNRVIDEIMFLKSLGVEHVFLEDDSLLAQKQRALDIFRKIIQLDLQLSDVNGINLTHLCTRRDNKEGIDEELLETMAEAGFTKLSFPVESGSQRIIKKYATNKVDLEKHDIPALIRKAKSLGIEVVGMYLFGYPDETMQELLQTFMTAQMHVDAGLDYANFHIVTPFPGTKFYDFVVENDLFLENKDIADLDWIKPSIKTIIPPETLEFMITNGFEFVNRNNPKRLARLRSMAPTGPAVTTQQLVESGQLSRV